MAAYPAHWLNETTIAQNRRLIMDKDMIRSKAFIELTGAAKQILLELYTRLTVDCLKGNKRSGGGEQYFAKNNGKLVFRYSDIHEMFGYSSDTISKALDRLVACGFIEIAELGIGAKKLSHKIALVRNWKDYGTPAFWAGKGKANKPFRGGFKKKIPLETGVL